MNDRRFDPYRFAGFLICTATATVFLFALWALAGVVLAATAGWTK